MWHDFEHNQDLRDQLRQAYTITVEEVKIMLRKGADLTPPPGIHPDRWKAMVAHAQRQLRYDW